MPPAPTDMPATSTPDAQTARLLRALVQALENKKAEQLTVLSVAGLSDVTDFLVLATGNSEPHLRALRIEAERVLDAAKAPIAGLDQGAHNSGWTVLDAYQIMVHLFTRQQRELYSLEKLWRDAVVVDLNSLEEKLAPKKSPAKRRVAPGKTSAKPKAAKTTKKTTASQPGTPTKKSTIAKPKVTKSATKKKT